MAFPTLAHIFWIPHKTMRYSARLIVAALLALSPAYPLARAMANPEIVLAQAPTFELPDTVPSGTTLSLQSSPNMGLTVEELKNRFEATYDDTAVNAEIASSDDAIAALLAGDIDLAAIGRPLTPEEADQGLTTVPLEREKIAIIVGPDNPFNGNLTFEQFAAMFRGEITDWSEVGGDPGPIRFVDRPEQSDTRRSLSQYEVFRNAPFELGATGEAVAEDDTAVVIQALGNDGISYAIAPHVLDQEDVKIISMHQTLPDDPPYPYSQPRYFVFQDAAAPAVAAFLGFATSPQGAEALAAARQAEAAAVATGLGTVAAEATTAGDTATADAEGVATDPDAAATDGTVADADPAAADTDAAPANEGTVEDGDAAAGAATGDDPDGAGWLWWLLPIVGLGALAWVFTRGKGGDTPTVERGATAAGTTPPPGTPPTSAPDAAGSTVGASGAAAGSADSTAAASSPSIDEVASKDQSASGTVPTAVTNGSTPAAESPAISESPTAAGNSNTGGEAVGPATGSPAPAAEAPPTVPDVAPTPMSGSAISAAAGAAGLAAGAAASLAGTEDQSAIEASKYNVVGRPTDGDIDLSDLDDGLPPLPDGYGESRIVLMPRDPQWAYAYWDTPSSHKEELRSQGGERLALRLYDVTDVDLSHQAPHSMQQFDCDELAREWYLQIPVSDRDYMVEIGYLAGDGRWLVLAKSNTVRVPPVYPSDWTEEHFMTVGWEENLKGKTLMTLVDPSRTGTDDAGLHDQMFALSQASEQQRVAGSIFGSMQQVPGSMVPQQSVSSYVFPSGVGMGFMPTMSGLNMSGVGFSASAPPIRPRKFWLVADAELIVYGATEPDASVTVGGNPIQLAPDGTFRFQTAFPDGQIDYPIMAVASDGEQNRSIHMKFERRTPERRTNTKEEAQEEWPEE